MMRLYAQATLGKDSFIAEVFNKDETKIVLLVMAIMITILPIIVSFLNTEKKRSYSESVDDEVSFTAKLHKE